MLEVVVKNGFQTLGIDRVVGSGGAGTGRRV
jgi:hypothetical protein